MAGPALSPEQLRLVTLGTAFGACPFELDRRLNRKYFEAAERAEIEANGDFAEADWREVVSSGGVRCFVVMGRPKPEPDPNSPHPIRPGAKAMPPIDNGLDIPSFLRRAQPEHRSQLTKS